jgi:bud site selection protein 20
MGKAPGRKVSGGGKSRTNKDHRRISQRGIVKARWDDICAAELNPEAIIQGRPQAAVVAEKTAIDPDKPGLGQHYCVACTRYMISARALEDHYKCAKHKRRLKTLLTEKPYSHAEANAAAGRGEADHGLTAPALPMTMDGM